MSMLQFATANTENARQIAFVLDNLDDWESLVANLSGNVLVHVLDASGDVLGQISTLLADQTGLSAIHLLGHGSAGSLNLGKATLDASTLPAYKAALERIGASLSEDGDILLYGCDVAQGEAGAELIGRLAQITGADVAASTDTTGASTLGGNWVLEAASGTVDVATLQVAGYAGVLAAPVISGLDPVTFIEGTNTPVLIDTNITFTGGSNYGGGYVRYAISDFSSGDQLTLTNSPTPNDSGAISFDAGVVYRGTGSGREPLGVIDSVENGQNGQALKINFVANFQNPGFESVTGGGAVTGWTIGTSRVILGTTVINGKTTPVDTTWPASSGDSDADPATMNFYSELSTTEKTEGNSSLRLYNTGNTQNGFDVVHGPYAFSNTFESTADDVLYFDWQAKAGGDAYDAFGYLMNADTGAYQIVLNETGANATGNKPWTTASVTVPTTGNWFFVFVSGTYDFTGGRAVGGSLFIDNFKVTSNSVTSAHVQAIAQQIAFVNTADDTKEVRNLTLTVADGQNNTTNAITTVTITQLNNSPTFTGPAKTVGGGSENGPITTVAQKVGTWLTSKFSDPDNGAAGSINNDTLAGIVIVGNPAQTEGTWQYSTNSTNGTDGDWHDVGTVTAATGLALDKDAWLKFTPTAYTGAPGAGTLQVHAVDSANYSGGTTDAPTFTTGNGSTRVTYDTTADDIVRSSVAKDPTALLAYETSANDAPVLATTTVNAGTVGERDDGSTAARANAGTTASALYDLAAGTDEDSATRVTPNESWGKGVAIYDITDAAGGKFQYSTNGGTTWTDVPAVSETGALLLGPNDKIRYVSDGGVGDVGTFKYYLWDGVTGSGTAGATNANVETANRGGGTGFSTDSATASITVVDKVYHPETLPATGLPSKNTTGPGVHTSGPLFVDPDGGAMAFTATLANGDPLPDWLSIDPATGILSGNPPADQTLSIKVTVTDDTSTPANATFNWTFGNTIDPLGISTATDTGADDLITRHPNPVLEFNTAAGATIVLKGPDGSPLTQGTNYSVSNTGGDYKLTLLDADVGTAGNQPFGSYANGVATSNTASTADGAYQILVNGSSIGTFRLDTTSPTRATITPQTTNTDQPLITGTVGTGALPAGETLTVTVNGATYENVVVAGDGSWNLDTATATPKAGTSLGAFNAGAAYDVTAVVTDAAGNSSTDNTGGEFRKTAPPTKNGEGLFTYTVPSGTFGGGGGFTYSATLPPVGGGAPGALPSWLSFDPVTQGFSGNPPHNATSPLVVRVTATDGLGNSWFTDLTFTFAGTNDTPVISGIPGGVASAPSSAISALPDFFVADADNDNLTVTLVVSNGGLYDVVDADPNTPGVQLTGSAASINTALSKVRFIPITLGPAEVQLSVTDGVIAAPVTSAYRFQVTLDKPVDSGNSGGSAPTPTPTPTPAPAPVPQTVDGTTVEVTSTMGADGTIKTTQTVAPVTGTRVEDTSTPNSNLADIPLASTSSGQPAVLVSLPMGVGLTSETTSAGTGTAPLGLREQLIAASQPRVQNTEQMAQIIADGIDQYVPTVVDQSQVTVRTITLTVAAPQQGGASTPAAQPIVIRGATGTGESDPANPLRAEALVIDARNLPPGTVLDLGMVEFAIVVGPATAIGGAGRNYVIGDDSAQFLVLGEGDDVLRGGGGDDTVGSKGGNDQLFGDDGNDWVVGGVGDDTLEGGSGNDVLVGGMSDAGTWSFKINALGEIVSSFVAKEAKLTDLPTLSLTGPWWSQTDANGNGYGIQSDDRLAFSYESPERLKAVALLYKAVVGQLPTLSELSAYSASKLSQTELATLAANYYFANQGPTAQSLEVQIKNMIETVWGAGKSSESLIALGADHINQGGTWADALLYLVADDKAAAPVTDALGNLSLAQSLVTRDIGFLSGAGNDVLRGGAGNDRLVGGPGNNLLDGGEGIDLFVTGGAVKDYTFHTELVSGVEQFVVTNKNTGAVNTLINMELAQIGGKYYGWDAAKMPAEVGAEAELASIAVEYTDAALQLMGVTLV